MNHQLAVMLAAITPREILVENVKESISEYEEAKLLNKSKEELEDLFRALATHAHLITINVMTKGSFEGVQEIMERMDELKKRDDFFNTSKSSN
jgi:NTP pyrophosphatase (non-canonical NTP hydrolase)